MENPRRTSEHLSRVATRLDVLRTFSAEMMPARQGAILEIGCGHGHFLTAYAESHPERFCLGLDICTERIERAARKKNRAKLANLHFLQASAQDFLSTLPSSTRLEQVFILFPDPWPKRRHHKNRIMQPAFLDTLSAFAGSETRIYFRTDDASYFRATAALVSTDLRWRICDEPWPFEYETVFQQRASGYQSLAARFEPPANISGKR